MAKGYWVVHVRVNDPDTYAQYVAAAKDPFAKYGARFIVRGGAAEQIEGSLNERHVVIEFDSVAQAKACYDSPEYQAALKLRHAGSDADLVIVEGVD